VIVFADLFWIVPERPALDALIGSAWYNHPHDDNDP
jgi:hypothetical protein